MSDLIELVRGASGAAKLWGHQVEAIIISEAADQLEAQQAEIARLRDIVVSAYHEGFYDALDEAPCCDVTPPGDIWPKTLSFAALEQNP